MKGWQAREAPMTRCLTKARVATILENSTTLEMVKMNLMSGGVFYFYFYNHYYYYLTLLRCARVTVAVHALS